MLRLAYTGVDAMPVCNTSGFSDALTMDPTDPRWLAATRLQVRIHTQLCRHPLHNIEAEHEDMVSRCVEAGFAPLHAEALVMIVHRACARGHGLDRTAMDELARLPMPSAKQPKGSRLLVFTILTVWAISIAGLMLLSGEIIG